MQYPRTSRVLDKMRRGEKVISYKFNLSCPRAVEIAALAGFDAAWICQEHVPTDFAVMEAQIMAAKSHDMDCIVRVPKGSYSDYIRPLEADAAGIMIPHLMSLEEAREIAHTVRFHPIGRRPVDGGNADGLYCRFDFKEYIKFANQNRLIIVQIEDPEPLSQLDEICQVEGIDMIFFGPGDFSHAIGHPAEFDHPEIHRVRKLVVETAHKYGKFAGTVPLPSLKQCYDEGFDFVNCGADVTAINADCDRVMNMYRDCQK
ncbi:MAG: aldolase [Lentisphaerae bacterium]|nr:aldolase [Lentisphaerota bacterium]